MAQKKKFNTVEPLQADPWLAWCSPVHTPETQPWILDYPEPCQWFERDQAEYLEYMRESFVAKYLLEAADEISDKAREIVAEVPDIKTHPLERLETLRIYTSETSPYTREPVVVPLAQLLDDNSCHCNLFRNLLMFAVAWPHQQAVNQLKELAPNVIHFLMTAHRFLQKKFAFANTMGLKRAAKKLEDADKGLCMIVFSGDLNKDAEQLFLVRKITPCDFRVAIRSALKFDREATDEINNGEQAASPLQQIAREELLKTIAEDARRGADAAESNSKKLNALTKWMTDWRKNGPKIDANNPPKTKISSTIRNKIVKEWEDYERNPEPIARKRGGKPSLAECLKYRCNKIVHAGKSLAQLLREARKDPTETAEATFRRLINSAGRNRSRNS